MTKLKVNFRNFAKASKKIAFLPISLILTEHLIKKNISIICNYISESYTSTYLTLQYSVYPLWCNVLRINEAGLQCYRINVVFHESQSMDN
jgi:fumarate reductase subunit D